MRLLCVNYTPIAPGEPFATGSNKSWKHLQLTVLNVKLSTILSTRFEEPLATDAHADRNHCDVEFVANFLPGCNLPLDLQRVPINCWVKRRRASRNVHKCWVEPMGFNTVNACSKLV